MSPEQTSPNPDFEPFYNICEFLTAIHIYTDEAKKGVTRYVGATHYYAHASKGNRAAESSECLIYDSHKKDAKLIGVEYMVPRHVYETFPPEEQKMWHSHELEVKSGMLSIPKPKDVSVQDWEKQEYTAMKEIVGLYGKTWHFWEVDAGHQYPIRPPRLMGSATSHDQVDLDTALEGRNRTFDMHHMEEAKARESIAVPDIHPNANQWWK